MLISEFARAAELSPDTVRFYVRRGLLTPETGRRGGSNPYQEFSRTDLAMARLVRLARSLGFTLREIAAIRDELQATGLSRGRRIAILEDRLRQLEDKSAQIARMTAYLRAKIAWMKGGERGPEPVLDLLQDRESLACAAEEAGVRARPARRRTRPR